MIALFRQFWVVIVTFIGGTVIAATVNAFGWLLVIFAIIRVGYDLRDGWQKQDSARFWKTIGIGVACLAISGMLKFSLIPSIQQAISHNDIAADNSGDWTYDKLFSIGRQMTAERWMEAFLLLETRERDSGMGFTDLVATHYQEKEEGIKAAYIAKRQLIGGIEQELRSRPNVQKMVIGGQTFDRVTIASKKDSLYETTRDALISLYWEQKTDFAKSDEMYRTRVGTRGWKNHLNEEPDTSVEGRFREAQEQIERVTLTEAIEIAKAQVAFYTAQRDTIDATYRTRLKTVGSTKVVDVDSVRAEFDKRKRRWESIGRRYNEYLALPDSLRRVSLDAVNANYLLCKAQWEKERSLFDSSLANCVSSVMTWSDTTFAIPGAVMEEHYIHDSWMRAKQENAIALRDVGSDVDSLFTALSSMNNRSRRNASMPSLHGRGNGHEDLQTSYWASNPVGSALSWFWERATQEVDTTNMYTALFSKAENIMFILFFWSGVLFILLGFVKGATKRGEALFAPVKSVFVGLTIFFLAMIGFHTGMNAGVRYLIPETLMAIICGVVVLGVSIAFGWVTSKTYPGNRENEQPLSSRKTIYAIGLVVGLWMVTYSALYSVTGSQYYSTELDGHAIVKVDPDTKTLYRWGQADQFVCSPTTGKPLVIPATGADLSSYTPTKGTSDYLAGALEKVKKAASGLGFQTRYSITDLIMGLLILIVTCKFSLALFKKGKYGLSLLPFLLFISTMAAISASFR